MSTNIEKWDQHQVEDQKFWESTGKSIAYRNLWISIPSLLLGFAIWMMWGIITVQMLQPGFPFSKDELFTLTAIAGLSGATLRIPSSFFIRIAGGRNTIFLTTALLMIPAFGTGIALQSKETPLIMFQLLALLSGIGGGNFACSMSNISTFFPKRLQGTALGLNAGLGNFGVTTMQILIPLVMTAGIFGAFAGGSMELIKDSAAGFSARSSPAPDLDSERRLRLDAGADSAGLPRLVRHEQPAADHPGHGRFHQRHDQGAVALRPGLRRRRRRPVSLPARPHRPGPAQHVGGAAADHGQHAVR
jgi:nitrate/nitrite transporter NarK